MRGDDNFSGDAAELEQRLAETESELARVESERAKLLSSIAYLRSELDGMEPGKPTAPKAPAVSDAREEPQPSAKVATFRGLFKGREHVHARLWQNRRTGRKGYSPACANEWAKGICKKPSVRCGECPDRSFAPLSDQAILDHLLGQQIIGIYPLKEDESCELLAFDFDGPSWREDTWAFLQSCESHGLSAYPEKSRSGRGSHVWIFFDGPVAASSARNAGSYMITETMERRHQLTMKSYDRIFPNQDTLPKGGFGNLIACPLQGDVVPLGNSTFLNDRLEPCEDQWAFLATIKRTGAERVIELSEEAVRSRKVTGVRFSGFGEDDLPWETARPAKANRTRLDEQLPERVRAILDNRLYVEKQGLPSSILNQIKRIAAFQNPKFYEAQKLRFSTALIPRIICCAEELQNYIALPRGLRDELEILLSERNATLNIEDTRLEGAPLPLSFTGNLSEQQETALNKMLPHDIGIFVAPPGSGKTVVGIALVAARARPTLIIVHRKPLLEQWRQGLASFLDMDASEIGQIGAGKMKATGSLDVAIVQSLNRKDQIDELIAGYGHVVVDECHHLPALSFERLLARSRARYITGLTATPYRRDGLQPIIYMQCGPIRHQILPRSAAGESRVEHRLVVRATRFACPWTSETKIHDVWDVMIRNEARNHLIADDVISALREGRNCLVLTERREHLELLADLLRATAPQLVVLRGGMRAKEKAASDLALASNLSTSRLLLATGSYIGEGFDDPLLDTLFLAMPIAFKGRLVQYAGRLHRIHYGKKEVRIFDYVDSSIPQLARMFQKRLKGYKALGYTTSNQAEDEPTRDRDPGESGVLPIF